MTSRSRSLARLAVVLVLATLPGRSEGQDSPLYRDPSPTEGPRIEGPILPARPPRAGLMPPPPSTLGPFQSSATAEAVGPAAEPLREPLLGIPPIAPPLPTLPMPPMQPGGDVQIRRKTTIRGPNGILGQFHEWFREALFGPPRPTVARRGHFGSFHPVSAEGDPPTRFFKWPSWPSWPLSDEH